MVAFGDDVPCLVVEIGSYNIKFGYAGEELPRSVFPSVVGLGGGNGDDKNISVKFGSDAVRHSNSIELRALVENGVWVQTKYIAALIRHAKEQILKIDEPMPLLIVESGENSAAAKKELCDAIFTEEGGDSISAVYFAKTPVAASFALGKHTSLVVDLGAEFTTVTPVVDGFVLKNNACKSRVAGNFLSSKYAAMLAECQPDYKPVLPFCIRSKKALTSGQLPKIEVRVDADDVSASIADFHRKRLFDDFKENCIGVPDVMSIGSDFKNIRHYEFPDGYNNSFDIGPIVDAIFAGVSATEADQGEFKGVSQLVHQCIGSCDVDLRNVLISNMVVCGGSSLIPGLVERLSLDLSQYYTPSKMKFLALSNSYEKRFTSWIGGSILGSLGTFQQLWISRKEFQEQGASIFNSKCL